MAGDGKTKSHKKKKAMDASNGVQFPAPPSHRVNDYINDFSSKQAKSIYSLAPHAFDDNGKIRSFSDQLAAYERNELKSHEHIIIARTSDNLPLPEAAHRPLLMKQSLIGKSLRKHGIPLKDLYHLPEWLNQHVLGTDSRTHENSICCIAPAVDIKGNHILIALHLDLDRNGIQIDEVLSIHGRPTLSALIIGTAEERKRFFVNERTTQWLDKYRNDLDRWAVKIIETAISSKSPEDARNRCWEVSEERDQELAEDILTHVKKFDAFVTSRLSGRDNVAAPFGTYEKSVTKIKKLASLAGEDGVEALRKLEKIEKEWAAAGNLSATSKSFNHLTSQTINTHKHTHND